MEDEAETKRLAAAVEFASTATRWFTTVLSIGIVVTIVFWSYRLGVRDASELPVIKAMNEPARSRPEDPGGNVADNQGLEVNEVLAGEEASIPVESQTAPPAVALSQEDVPARPEETPDENGAPTQPDPDPAITFITDPPGEDDPASEERESDPVAVFDPFAEVPGQVDTTVAPPSRPEEAPTEPEVATTTEPEQSTQDQQEAAREQAERERAAQERAAREREEREQRERENAAQAARDEEARKIQEALEAALREEEAERQATTPNPNLRVQLGSFNSEIDALGFLDTLTSRHGDLLASRRISVQKVTIGTRVEFRIRASGFTQSNETGALCQALRARGVDCVPVGG